MIRVFIIIFFGVKTGMFSITIIFGVKGDRYVFSLLFFGLRQTNTLLFFFFFFVELRPVCLFIVIFGVKAD